MRDSARIDGVSDPAPPITRQVVPPPIDDINWYTVEKFWKNRAEIFKGGSNPMKVESWIDIIEKNFKACLSPIASRLDWQPVALGGSISLVEVNSVVHIY